MRVLCIWGDTRADVLKGYDEVAKLDEPPQRITWRLASAFTGKKVGHDCFAPDHPDIRAAYGELIELDEVEDEDDDE